MPIPAIKSVHGIALAVAAQLLRWAKFYRASKIRSALQSGVPEAGGESMWSLTIECIAFVALCIVNPSAPPIKLDYATQAQCERALIDYAKRWQPVQGAWTMNCVKR